MQPDRLLKTVVSDFINKFYAWQNHLIPSSMPVSQLGFQIKRTFKPQPQWSKRDHAV
jgi:hypothetical protein